MIDGFDMRGFELGRLYVVDRTLGRYLVTAGYASTAETNADDRCEDDDVTPV